MLKACPECELPISDKAITCPHCGYPLKPNKKPSTPRNRSNKRKRLPNGFGQISEIKNNNLRNPFRAMVTVGKTSTGRPILRMLKPHAYFKTYNDAYTALLKYNKNPYDLDSTLLVSEVYKKWTAVYFSHLKSESSKRTITSVWPYCSSVYNMRIADLRARHIKGCMENGVAIVNGVIKNPSVGTQSRIKSMFNLMLDYALEYELVDKNYARTFSLSKELIEKSEKDKIEHIPFTDKEIAILWDNVNKIKYVDVILIQCYSGWRPQELGLIKLENVNLEEGVFIGGMKTKVGTNRTVPIHSKIKQLVENKYKEAESLNSNYLINSIDKFSHHDVLTLTYSKYSSRFKKIIERLNINQNHRPHDGRVTFVTLAKKYAVDEYAIKYMVGHEIHDITENTYTKRENSWLKSEIEKIK